MSEGFEFLYRTLTSELSACLVLRTEWGFKCYGLPWHNITETIGDGNEGSVVLKNLHESVTPSEQTRIPAGFRLRERMLLSEESSKICEHNDIISKLADFILVRPFD